MTGLCRLIRGCAAQTAGPFVRRSERRKLAVLIPLFMSSREKKRSTLQPCPLHPFRGWREEGGSSPVAPQCLVSPSALGSPERCSKGGGRGCFVGASIVSFWEMGARAPGPKDTGWWEFLPLLMESKDPICPPFPRKVALGSACPPSPLRSNKRQKGDASLGSSEGGRFRQMPGTEVSTLVLLRVSGLTIPGCPLGPFLRRRIPLFDPLGNLLLHRASGAFILATTATPARCADLSCGALAVQIQPGPQNEPSTCRPA